MESLTLNHVNQFFKNDLKYLMEKLSPKLKPLWGKMTPQHAVEHITWSLRMSNGKEVFPVYVSEEKIPRQQRFLFSLWAIPHHFKSPLMDKNNLPPLRQPDIESAKKAFWKEWADFQAFFKKNPDARTPNPVFGYLSEELWRRFHFKHFVHHLAQFGVTTNEDNGLKER